MANLKFKFNFYCFVFIFQSSLHIDGIWFNFWSMINIDLMIVINDTYVMFAPQIDDNNVGVNCKKQVLRVCFALNRTNKICLSLARGVKFPTVFLIG